jgi:hypothetical protein
VLKQNHVFSGNEAKINKIKEIYRLEREKEALERPESAADKGQTGDQKSGKFKFQLTFSNKN